MYFISLLQSFFLTEAWGYWELYIAPKKRFLQMYIYFLYSCYTAIKYTLININLFLTQLLVYNI